MKWRMSLMKRRLPSKKMALNNMNTLGCTPSFEGSVDDG